MGRQEGKVDDKRSLNLEPELMNQAKQHMVTLSAVLPPPTCHLHLRFTIGMNFLQFCTLNIIWGLSDGSCQLPVVSGEEKSEGVGREDIYALQS